MWWWHANWGWWGWLVMSITMLAFWGLIVWAVVAFVRSTGETGQRNPEALLAERFARGEIDEDEYRRRLEVISGNRATVRH